MKYTEEVVKTRGGDLLLRRGGKGPTLLFLHGAGGAAGSEAFFEKLADRFDLVAPDHPGFGRSPLPPWLEDIADLAYFYLDLIGELGLKDVHVVGHSMGGWLALETAIRSQQDMKSLTLLSPVGIRIKGNPVANVFIMTPDQLMNALFADPKIAAAELARVPTSEQLDEIVKNRTTAARLGWHPRFFNPKLSKWLHRVKLPTQILWGAEDKIVSPAYADEFKRFIPHATVTKFPGAGHIPYAEKLDDTTAAIGNFALRNA